MLSATTACHLGWTTFSWPIIYIPLNESEFLRRDLELENRTSPLGERVTNGLCQIPALFKGELNFSIYIGKENSVVDRQTHMYGGWVFKPDMTGKAALVTSTVYETWGVKGITWCSQSERNCLAEDLNWKRIRKGNTEANPSSHRPCKTREDSNWDVK